MDEGVKQPEGVKDGVGQEEMEAVEDRVGEEDKEADGDIVPPPISLRMRPYLSLIGEAKEEEYAAAGGTSATNNWPFSLRAIPVRVPKRASVLTWVDAYSE